jgi:hypothetical protein
MSLRSCVSALALTNCYIQRSCTRVVLELYVALLIKGYLVKNINNKSDKEEIKCKIGIYKMEKIQM